MKFIAKTTIIIALAIIANATAQAQFRFGVKGGITIKAGIDYNIAPKEMNRLSELDLASYDDSGANEEFLAVGEKVMNENRIDKMYDKIPNDYKITARCVTYYDVDVKD